MVSERIDFWKGMAEAAMNRAPEKDRDLFDAPQHQAAACVYRDAGKYTLAIDCITIASPGAAIKFCCWETRTHPSLSCSLQNPKRHSIFAFQKNVTPKNHPPELSLTGNRTRGFYRWSAPARNRRTTPCNTQLEYASSRYPQRTFVKRKSVFFGTSFYAI